MSRREVIRMATKSRIVLALLLLLAAPLAEAGEKPHGRRHGPPPLDAILERNAERLGIDAETLARIRATADAYRPEHDRLKDEVHALRRELRGLLEAESPDREAVMAVADRIGATETALDKHRLATLLEVRAMLTPEQREELVSIFEERRRERHERKKDRER
jgi:Spy/CpxP family protein refolding chaperone